jgi:hypothetical protein
MFQVTSLHAADKTIQYAVPTKFAFALVTGHRDGIEFNKFDHRLVWGVAS